MSEARGLGRHDDSNHDATEWLTATRARADAMQMHRRRWRTSRKSFPGSA